MNERLAQLTAYPFERLARLKAGQTPPAGLAHIAMSIGEPRHAPPAFVIEALRQNAKRIACVLRFPARCADHILPKTSMVCSSAAGIASCLQFEGLAELLSLRARGVEGSIVLKIEECVLHSVPAQFFIWLQQGD